MKEMRSIPNLTVDSMYLEGSVTDKFLLLFVKVLEFIHFFLRNNYSMFKITF